MLAKRGIHTCPWLSPEGHPCLAAVDGNHRIVSWRVLWPHENPADVMATLEAELAHHERLNPVEYPAALAVVSRHLRLVG